MKTIACIITLLLATSIYGQDDQLNCQDSLMKWIMERIARHGVANTNYYKDENDMLWPFRLRTYTKADSIRATGLISYYGMYNTDGDQQGNIKYFDLTDILCVEKNWLYNNRAILVHINNPRVMGLTEIGGKIDTIYADNSQPHYTTHLVLSWRGERKLYRKMFRYLKALSAMNKKSINQYTFTHAKDDRFYNYRR